MPPPGRGAGRPGAAGAPGRVAAGRLRFPVAACGADGGCADGRTSMGRRGVAGGAWPVRGSSTRKRSVGGTTRPVVAGRGAGGSVAVGCCGTAAAGAADTVGPGACDAPGSGGGAPVFATTRSGSTGGGGAITDAGGGSCADSTQRWSLAGSGAISTGTGAGGAKGSAADGGTAAGSGAGLADFTRRGGGRAGATGLGGSAALPAGFFPLAAAGVSANDALDGTVMLRCRARRETNSRATTSSIVLDALFTSMP